MAQIESLTRRVLRQPYAQRSGFKFVLCAGGGIGYAGHDRTGAHLFLDFDFVEKPDAVSVRIIAPESARESADMLFQQFLNGA